MSLLDMAPGLMDRGWDVHILPLMPRLHLALDLTKVGAVVHMPPSRTGRASMLRHTRDLVSRLMPDVVHTTLFEADVAGRIAARASGVPVSSSIVTDSYGPSHYAESNRLKLGIARAIDRTTAKFASRIHVVSASIADSVAPRLRIPKAKIDIIPRGRNASAFPFRTKTTRKDARQSLGLDANIKMLLSVARLEPAKGLNHLIAAIPYLLKRNPECLIMIAGSEGRSSADLKQAAASLGDRVRFLGHRDDISTLMTAADVLCFPSEREGLPGVLIEAMATGCPIVASDIAPCREVLGGASAGNGLFFRTGSVGQLVQALSEVVDNTEAAEQRARLARTRFEQYFATDIVTASMDDFLRRVAAAN